MEKFAALLGIISLFLVGVYGGGNADIDTVSVPFTSLDVKPGQNVSLSCMGTQTNLQYYISNRVGWRRIEKDGTETIITDGFYKEKSLVDLFEGPNPRYELTYGEDAAGYRFSVNITGVKDSDNGVYKCALVDSSDKVLDSKLVTVTVLNPVEKVTLEVHDPDTHSVLAKSTGVAPAMEMPVKLKPGIYMIMCKAEGSNPKSTMQFKYDETTPYIVVDSKKNMKAGRVQYSSQFSLDRFELKAMGDTDQILSCSANIPGNHYQSKTATIKMQVKVDKPDMVCNNVSRMIGDNYAKFECNITAPGGLECDMVKWIIGDTSEVINSEAKYGTAAGTYDIIQTECSGLENNLKASLVISRVNEAHFETIFYLSYGIGEDAHRVANQLILKAGSSGIASFSMLVYLVFALITKQVMQRF